MMHGRSAEKIPTEGHRHFGFLEEGTVFVVSEIYRVHASFRNSASRKIQNRRRFDQTKGGNLQIGNETHETK